MAYQGICDIHGPHDTLECLSCRRAAGEAYEASTPNPSSSTGVGSFSGAGQSQTPAQPGPRSSSDLAAEEYDRLYSPAAQTPAEPETRSSSGGLQVDPDRCRHHQRSLGFDDSSIFPQTCDSCAYRRQQCVDEAFTAAGPAFCSEHGSKTPVPDCEVCASARRYNESNRPRYVADAIFQAEEQQERAPEFHLDRGKWCTSLHRDDRDQWVLWTVGSLEDVLDDAMDFRAGRLSGYDTIRIEIKREAG